MRSGLHTDGVNVLDESLCAVYILLKKKKKLTNYNCSHCQISEMSPMSALHWHLSSRLAPSERLPSSHQQGNNHRLFSFLFLSHGNLAVMSSKLQGNHVRGPENSFRWHCARSPVLPGGWAWEQVHASLTHLWWDGLEKRCEAKMCCVLILSDFFSGYKVSRYFFWLPKHDFVLLWEGIFEIKYILYGLNLFF